MSILVKRVVPGPDTLVLCSACPGAPKVTIEVRRGTTTTIRLCRLCWRMMMAQARKLGIHGN